VKPLVIYHSNCADGFAAAWVFKRYGNFDCDFHAGVYQKEQPDCTGRDVYLVDFSYKRAVVEEILKVATRVVLIDHHKTAIEDLAPLIESKRIEAFTDLYHSGCVLAWKWFYGNVFDKMPSLLWHIEDRDLWRFYLPFTREINANVFSYPFTFEAFDELARKPIDLVKSEGAALERKHWREVEAIVANTKREITLAGITCPLGNVAPMFQSDVGHALAKAHSSKMAVMYQDTNDGRVFSLRSTNDGPDVSEIAKLYGGGGHRNAAGFRVVYEHELAILRKRAEEGK
jgi:uncharacterized protein